MTITFSLISTFNVCVLYRIVFEIEHFPNKVRNPYYILTFATIFIKIYQMKNFLFIPSIT